MSSKSQKKKKYGVRRKILKIYFPIGKILLTIDGINSSL